MTRPRPPRPTPTVAGLQSGDSVTSLSESYGTANAGSGLTLSVNGGFAVNDGNGGNNYTVSTVNNTSGVIDQLAVVLSGSRTYDGTANAAASSLTVTNDLDGANLTLSGIGTLASRNAGTESFAAPGTLALTGSAAGNYTLGAIAGNGSAVTVGQAALTLTAQANSKTYDATNTAAAAPTVAGLQSGDSVTSLSESYGTANAGSGLTLSVNGGFAVTDGNGGNNYTVSTVNNTSGAIDQLAVMLSGSRTYDGTANAAASNLTVSNDLDGANLTLSGIGTLASRNAGTESFAAAGTLALTGSAAGNYTLGAIAGNGSAVTVGQAALTLTAQANTKTYDATTTAAAAPTVAGLQSGDSVTSLSESYGTANAGSGLTLSVNGGFAVADGNGGNNYTVSTVNNTSGAIDQLAVMLSGSRTYDGTANAAATNLTISNNLDGANLTLSGIGTLASRNAGTESFAAPGTLALTGSAAGNYTLGAIAGNGSAVNVGQAALTLTAQANSKTYDATNTAAAAPTVAGLQSGDSVTSLSESYGTANAGSGLTLSVNGGFAVADGNGGNNYTVSTVNNTSGAIDQLAVMLSGSRTYDGTANAAATNLTISNNLDGANLTLSGIGTLASRNAGTESFAAAGTLALDRQRGGELHAGRHRRQRQRGDCGAGGADLDGAGQHQDL